MVVGNFFEIFSKKLPTTKEELLQVDYMTEFRVKQYSSVILGTTETYQKMRMEHLKTLAAARQEKILEEERNRIVEPRSTRGRKGRGRGKKKVGRKKKAGGSTIARGRGSYAASSNGFIGRSSYSGTSRGGTSMRMPTINRFGVGSAGQFSFL